MQVPRALNDARIVATDAPLNQASTRPFALAIDPTRPPAGLERAVYAVGNFDGVHRGHAAVIARTLALAANRRAPAAVLTFEPHPGDYFAGRPVVFRLTPLPIKARIFRSLGLAGAVALTFDAALAGLSAEEFIEQALVARLGVGAVVVGRDFHFGRARGGAPGDLVRAGARLGFTVEVIDKVEAPIDSDAEVVSSSVIRRALERGDVEAAARGLGRDYVVAGIVVHGKKVGRSLLDMPTANLTLEPANRLAFGVYAVRAAVGGKVYGGVASFGVRPTINSGAPQLEVHLFDFSGDLYGQPMEVAFVARLREERKFASIEALKEQMARDLADARAAIAARKFGDSGQII